MSRRCESCGRAGRKSASRSHSNIKTVKRQHVNLQMKTIDGERKKVCANCIKTSQKNPSARKDARAARKIARGKK